MKQVLANLLREQSPSGKIFTFMTLMGLGLMITAGMLVLLTKIDPSLDTENKAFLMVGQLLQHLLVFGIPGWVALYMTQNTSIFSREKVSLNMLILSLPIMALAGPLVEYMSYWNGQVSLDWISPGLADTLMNQQESTTASYKAILSVNGMAEMIGTAIVIAIVPAFAEEFFFRSGLQRLLIQWCRNPHVGIWLGAALFSAIHLQPFDFLPRLMLGAALGYMFYWSGSLWPGILAHAINNAGALFMVWVMNEPLTSATEHTALPTPTELGLYSSMFIANLMLFYRAVQRRKASIAPTES